MGSLDPYLRAEMALNEIPGVSLALVRGQQVLTASYGVRSLRTGAPMTTQTPVELASLSKSLTALAAWQLSEAGTLDLDAAVARYLPEFGPESPTVRDLIRHTSGFTRRDDYLPRSQLAGLRRPRGSFAYANCNYVLLAAVVERAAGEPFSAHMEKRVFAPLGMTHTTLDPERSRAWGQAEPHERQWGRMRPSPSPLSGWHGASAVKSSAEDMGRYLAYLLSSSLAARIAAQETRYDLGWNVRAGVLEHSGDIWGGNTAALVIPEQQLGVVVLANAGVHRALDIARGVAARMAGLAGPAAAAAPPSQDPDYWAIRLTAAAVALLAITAAWLARIVRRPLPDGFSFVALIRAAGLVAMSVYLVYLVTGGAGVPPSAWPATIRIALPLLVAAVVAVLLAAALAGLVRRA
jgi:CubicO group peptidase (beta-lactamase class C family)